MPWNPSQAAASTSRARPLAPESASRGRRHAPPGDARPSLTRRADGAGPPHLPGASGAGSLAGEGEAAGGPRASGVVPAVTPNNNKRRRVSDASVLDLTMDESPIVLDDSLEPAPNGADEVQVVGVQPPPSPGGSEVELVESRDPLRPLADQPLPPPPRHPTDRLRAFRSRRPLRMAHYSSGPPDRGQSSRSRDLPGGSGSHGASGSRHHPAPELDADRASIALAQTLQEEEDRRAAMASRMDQALGARLEALHAQEQLQEEDAAQASSWRQALHASLAGSRIADAMNFGRPSSSRHPPPAGSPYGAASTGLAWPHGRMSPGSMLSYSDFGGLLFGASFGPMPEVRFLTEQANALRQMREGRLPPHMLMSDRDFDENDYEALLALDEGVENRKGATKSAINQLPTEKVASSSRKKNAACPLDRCTVCLEEPQAGETLRTLPCRHKFHKQCIDKWLATKACCPICQQGIN